MSNGTFNLDEWRRTSIGIREGELVLQEIQTRLRREQLEDRLQTQQMWIDDGLGWVEEEQLRLDGAESCLTQSLSRLEQERLIGVNYYCRCVHEIPIDAPCF